MYNKKLSFMLGILLASSLVMVSATQNGGRAPETTSPVSARVEKRADTREGRQEDRAAKKDERKVKREEKKQDRMDKRDEKKDERKTERDERKDKREEKKDEKKEKIAKIRECRQVALEARAKTKLNIQKEFVASTTLLRTDRLQALEAVLTASTTATTTKGIAQERREKRQLIQKDFEAKRKLANADRKTNRENTDKDFQEAVKVCRDTSVGTTTIPVVN